MATLLTSPLVLPELFQVVEETPRLGKYLFKPLEPGYGITVGNALRRVLLASIEGYAIATLKIPGVLHEFSTIPGVIEDVVDIVLNLKQVALRPRVQQAPTRIFIEIKGKEVFTAGDIQKAAPQYEVANPDLVILHLDDQAVVQMELTVAKGRGYALAEENKLRLKDSLSQHEIVLDTSFSPVVRVVPRVETILYGDRADYEQLLLEIETKGNVHPREALREATQILLEHFNRLLEGERTAGETISSPSSSLARLLNTPLTEVNLGLSTAIYNSLRNAGVHKLIDLVQLTPKDLEKFRGIGKESLQRIEAGLKELGLSLGMDVSPYKTQLPS